MKKLKTEVSASDSHLIRSRKKGVLNSMNNVKISPYYLKRICNYDGKTETSSLSDIITYRDNITVLYDELDKAIEELNQIIYNEINLMQDEVRKKAINTRRIIRKKKLSKVKPEDINIFSKDVLNAYNRCRDIEQQIAVNYDMQEKIFLENMRSSIQFMIDEKKIISFSEMH